MNSFAQMIRNAPHPLMTLSRLLDNQIKPTRTSKKFIIDTIPYTSPVLINKLLEKLPPIRDRCLDTKIGVIYTVEIAIFLVGLGFNDVTLYTNEHDPLMARGAETFGYKYEILDGTMRPDVVVGNPPYTDGTKAANNIFIDFVTKYIKDVEYAAFVFPITCFHSTATELKDLREFLFAHGLKSIAINPIDLFKSDDVRTNTACYFFERNYAGTIEMFPETGESYHFDYRKHGVILDGGSLIGTNMILRTQTSTKYRFNRNTKCPFPKHLSLQEDGTPTLVTINKGVPRIEKTSAPPLAKQQYNKDTVRIVNFYQQSDYKRTFQNIGIVEDPNVVIPKAFIYAHVNLRDAQSLRTYLGSKFVRFIQVMTRTSRTIDNSQLKFIPFIKTAPIKSDEDVYKHHNLTSEEIKLIEDTIK